MMRGYRMLYILYPSSYIIHSNASAPLSPILFHLISRVVIVSFFANAFAPSSLILFQSIFDDHYYDYYTNIWLSFCSKYKDDDLYVYFESSTYGTSFEAQNNTPEIYKIRYEKINKEKNKSCINLYN
jgi:hypothetical protein